jgi:endo-1,4-beta-xylanase
MVERGVPIHGVGLQMHLRAGGIPKGILENMDRLADLDLEVQVTELDVRLHEQGKPNKLDQQAKDYRTVVETCLQAKRCTAVIMWGFTDRHSWIPHAFEGYGEALILDEQYQPKPAYEAVREALSAP